MFSFPKSFEVVQTRARSTNVARGEVRCNKFVSAAFGDVDILLLSVEHGDGFEEKLGVGGIGSSTLSHDLHRPSSDSWVIACLFEYRSWECSCQRSECTHQGLC